jgi:hypothetical protein
MSKYETPSSDLLFWLGAKLASFFFFKNRQSSQLCHVSFYFRGTSTTSLATMTITGLAGNIVDIYD